ncbi:hypothetical protein L228DRAFT_269338 [Xylona heveae TC161]|uniref:CUE domain-containing protein n=1 Tax=Xylona heveae (strain CBS 132557 / TC161) TaxID=1328760 RepID=A0A165G8Z7_XYLHT|nr:hypothetical protein L228DRAFT_269338 [Xylona heveae TC161]KZF21890.1 hypothetical protein L228DRAFT_269338 [Xylona heveae TC161]
MPLPPIAPFPPSFLRRDIAPSEWESCLDAWVLLIQLRLHLSAERSSSESANDDSLHAFLSSYVHESSRAFPGDVQFSGVKAKVLRRECFLLIHRLLSEASPPPAPLLGWKFLVDLSRVYGKSASLRKLLGSVWTQHQSTLVRGLQKSKASLIGGLEDGHANELEDELARLGPLFSASRDIATFFMTGSDFLDALCIGYARASDMVQLRILAATYLGLISLIDGEKPNFSALFDHLYTLKRTAESAQKKGSLQSKSLVVDLVTNTPLLRHLEERATGSESARAKSIVTALQAFHDANARRKRPIRRKVSKGKGKAARDPADAALEDIHIHRMSLVTQIQDLFPDLGSGFIVRLLDEYGDDVEQVTAHLLDDSLPAHLRQADRSEDLPSAAQDQPEQPPNLASHLVPRSTPPPTSSIPSRRNVYDDDEFDRLAIDTSKLHVGRRDANLTADHLLSSRQNAPNKAAIISALSAFDADDDERDDTYDLEDVGGTVDSTTDYDGDRARKQQGAGKDAAAAAEADRIDRALFSVYTTLPNTFNRDAATRRSQPRQSLRRETGLTDEAIEGWAVMLGREPKRLRKMEEKFKLFGAGGAGAGALQQPELPSTKYKGVSSAEDNDEDDYSSGPGSRSDTGPSRGGRGRGGGGAGRGRGAPRGRGRGGGAGGPGGPGDKSNLTGPSGDKNTQISRQRKESSKSSRANHNRRDQRAKKMARGGMLPS